MLGVENWKIGTYLSIIVASLASWVNPKLVSAQKKTCEEGAVRHENPDV